MATTHTFNSASDWTITDSEYIKQSGDAVVARDLNDFTNSDLSDFVPLQMDELKSIWRTGRVLFSSTTYQPKTGDGVSDESGYLRLTASNQANSGWFSVSRQVDGRPMYGSSSNSQTAVGKVLDVDIKWSANAQASQIFFSQDTFSSQIGFSLSSAQYFLDGKNDNGVLGSRTNSGSLTPGTKYYVRFTFSSASVVCKFYPTDTDRTNDTNVARTSSMDIQVSGVSGVSFFIRGSGSAEDTIDIYKLSGSLIDSYGQDKSVLFNDVDFGATPEYLKFNTAAATATGSVVYQYRVQSVDGVWGSWSDYFTLTQLQKLTEVSVYAFQINTIFNPYSGASVAQLDSFSIQSDTTPSATTPESGDIDVTIAITSEPEYQVEVEDEISV